MMRAPNKPIGRRERRTVILLLCCLLTAPFHARAQDDSTTVDKKRRNTLLVVAGAGYAGTLVTLNHLWYKNTERQSFRFFNDNAEWKQVDKAGHIFASFYLSDLSSRIFRSCNLPARKADLFGSLTGFLLTVPIEIFDGYSSGYGASAGDLVADAVGPAVFLSQKLLWDEIRIHPKFSFQRTRYPALRPELLGDNLLSEVVKDYNGQTYWLSIDLDKFTTFPKWLNIAVGYGAQEMIYSRDYQNVANGYNPYRQYYLAVDFDLTSIKTQSPWLKPLLYLLNTVRLPAPAIEFSRRGSRFHAFYF